MVTIKRALCILFVLISVSPTVLALSSADILPPFTTVICALYTSYKYVIPALAVLIFAIAGALWLYSQEDAGKRNAAKTWILHIIIGAIIATLAWTIANEILTARVTCT